MNSRTVRTFALLGVATALLVPGLATGSEVSGDYMEARTCQVYTGPCFANAEVGLTGKDAIMAWKIQRGLQQGVDLSGLSVVVVVSASGTLDFQGLDSPKQLRSVILVDDNANTAQRDALVAFARQHAGRAGQSVVRIDTAPIAMSLDTTDLRGKLTAGDEVKLTTRKARADDCICSNEAAYYPPLAEVSNSASGVAMEGEFKGRGLSTRWSVPGSRSAYMATFTY